MRKGYKVTLGILTIMILLTITVGTSYSFYSVSDAQDSDNSLTSTCFNIEFKDEGEEQYKGSIKLNADGKYAYPMKDTDATQKLTPYTFTIKNTCTQENSAKAINYTVTLGTVKNQENGLTNYLKYQLNEKSGATGNAKELTTTSSYPLSEDIKTTNNISESYELVTGTLAPGTSKTYDLYLWIKDDACEGTTCETTVMGKTFEGRLLVYSTI